MGKLYSFIHLNRSFKFNWLINIVLVLFALSSQSQTLTNTFTYGNGNLGQVPIYICEGDLHLNISYSVQNSDAIVLYFPNSFHVSGLPVGFSVTDSLNGFVEVTFPVSGTNSLNLNFQLKNCINNLAANGSNVNTSNLKFQSYLQSNLGNTNFNSSYFYNNGNMQTSSGSPTYVIFSSATPPFIITPLTNTNNFQGTADQEYIREFEIKVFAPTVQSFNFDISQETDAKHLELSIVDINPIGGIVDQLIDNSIGLTNIIETINLNSLESYFATTPTPDGGFTRTLRFKQKVKLLCYQPNNSTIISLIRDCCPADFVTTASMNGKIEYGQTFSNTSLNISPADSTVEPSCGGSYNYDLKFSKSGAITFLSSIKIPLNFTYIDEIENVFIGNSIDSLVLINYSSDVGYNIDSSNLANSSITINLPAAFPNDSTSNWPGFQAYANLDSTNGLLGPWLDTNLFYLRIRFKYDCKQQQDCSRDRFYLQGKRFQYFAYLDSILFVDAPIRIYWKNSCEVDTFSNVYSSPIEGWANNSLIGSFVNMDHEMEEDRVSYTFYPNNYRPFRIDNFLGLSCDTVTKYRALFHIPVPEQAIDTISQIDYSVNELFVGNLQYPVFPFAGNSSDSAYFFNGVLQIPLGTNLHFSNSLDFSFNYVLNSCPFYNPPNSGGIDLELEIQAYCASCEECYKTVACSTMSVVVHCPGDCSGNVPMSTKNVKMERTTFGFRDSLDFPYFPIINKDTLFAIIDSTINATTPYLNNELRESIKKGELSKLYPFDIVKLTSKGNIGSYPNLSSNGPFQFNNIAFELAHTPIGNNPLFALKYASLTFIDSAIADTFVVPLVMQNINPYNTEVFGMDGDTLNSFELAIPNLSALPQYTLINTGTFKLELDAEFWVLPDTTNSLNPVIVRGQFICSTNVDGSITPYSCDPWGARLQVLVPKKSITLTTQNDTASHCVSNAKFRVRLSGGLGINIDDFPYEFRPFIGYRDTAFSSNFIEGYAVENGIDTIVFSDTLGRLWNPNYHLLHPLEKPGFQDIYIKANKFCANGSDTIPYNIPIFDFGYLSPLDSINTTFAPMHLLGYNALHLSDYMFYDSVNVSNINQGHIQSVETPYWQYYSSPAIFSGLLPGFPSSSQTQGIAESDSIHFNLHIKAPDSLAMGNCWLSYKFSANTTNAPNLPVTIRSFSDTIPYLTDSLSIVDSLGEVYHFFEEGFPLDSVSSQLSMPVVCGQPTYKLSVKYGCFCIADSFLTFKENVNLPPSCLGGGDVVNFQRQGPDVNIASQLQVNNDTLGCDLTWLVTVSNPSTRPNLTQGKLLINIPSGLVLNTTESSYSYYLQQGDTLAVENGNYNLNDSIVPNYSFQFEDFDIPPTTVLVLAFPSVDTLQAGANIQFALKFKLDQSTCSLPPSVFQSNFLYRILEARFSGFTECDTSNLYTSSSTTQNFLNNTNQIINMVDSSDCCLQSAATVSLKHPCSATAQGNITFHFEGEGGNQITLYQIDSTSNEFVVIIDTTLTDSVINYPVNQGLYSATVTTSGGLIYVFNSLVIQNHGVDAHILLTQNSLCGGSPIILNAVDSNAVNNLGFNNSNPFIAIDTLVTNVLSYQWSNNATADSLLNYATAYDAPNNDTSYSVIVIHLSGCRDTASLDVNLYNSINVSMSVTDDTICSLVSTPILVSPHGGELTINGITVLDSTLTPSYLNNGLAEVIYRVTSDSGCVYADTAQIIALPTICNCLPCESYNSTVYQIDANFNEFLNATGITSFNNACFQVNSDFTNYQNLTFTDCNFIVAGGVKLINKAFLTLQNCTFKGCQQMWAGIYNNKCLSVIDCDIYDAHYAISMEREGSDNFKYTIIENSIFQGNLVGLINSQNYGQHDLKIFNVNFIGDTLLPQYPWQYPVPQSYSLAGIVAQNAFNINLYSSNFSANFSNICNGILLTNKSSAIVRNARFNNIQNFGTTYQGSNYWLDNQPDQAPENSANGNGIFGFKNCFVNVLGVNYNLPNNLPRFNNCNRAVSINNCDLQVTNTNIGLTNTGIRAINEKGKKVFIGKNQIQTRFVGVNLLNCDNIASATVEFNKISSLSSIYQSNYFQNKGIILSNIFAAPSNSIIIGNNISARVGIEVFNAPSITIQSDTVQLIMKFNNAFTATAGSGISLFNSEKSRVLCNFINGVNTNSHECIKLTSSQSCEVNNNTVHRTKRGFLFSLDCTSENNIKLNTIKTHQIGLDITSQAFIGKQTNVGNRWVSSYSITGARRLTNSATSSLSRFIVKDATNPILRPSFLPLEDFNCGSDFFSCSFENYTVPTPFCENILYPNYYPLNSNEEENKRIAELLAKDSIYFDEFDASVKFGINKRIAGLLQSYELTLPDTGSFVDYVYFLEQSAVSDYAAIDKDKNKEILSEYLKQRKENAAQVRYSATMQLLALDSIAAALNFQLSDDLKTQMQNLKDTLAFRNNQLTNIDSLLRVRLLLRNDSLDNNNSSIVTQETHEQYEQRINNIYFKTIGSDLNYFSVEQINTIAEIAQLCPALGGSATFKARSLYALINDTIIYDDENLCLTQGFAYRSAGKVDKIVVNSDRYLIFPNPTTGIINIKSNSNERQILSISVFDITGRLISEEKINLENQATLNSLSAYSAGIYYLRIRQVSNGVIQTNKIIKQ